MIDRVLREGVARFDVDAVTEPSDREAVRRNLAAIASDEGETPTERQLDTLVERAMHHKIVATDEFDVARLVGIPVIVADDVGRYWTELPEGVNFGDMVATMAPPFDRFWIEFQRVPNDLDLHAWGVLIEDSGEAPLPFEGDDGAPRWVLTLTLVAELGKRAAMGPVARFVVGLAEDGTWFHHHDGAPWFGGGLPRLTEHPPREVEQDWAEHTKSLVFPALLTISFMHCRNVEVRTVEPPQALSKRHERKSGRPLVTYHVLDIDPMRRVLDGAGARDGPGGIRRALHIARGHFKVFTEDAPLFGRHTGTYWWGPQVRGRSDEGIAAKDYRVGAPGRLGVDYVRASEEPGPPPAPKETDPDAAGRGKAAHGRVQNLVADAVAAMGLRPVQPQGPEPLYDVAWMNGDTTWVCEVKSLTSRNEERQMQRAIGQVLRYRQKMTALGRDVQALIVTEHQPEDATWGTLCGLEDVVLAWPGVLEGRLKR